ncbi:hypothetical protein IJJ18_03235 [Candidatus Saccharibacteria bacterium]|nr:hypothetical protein [Candidatus Saccharibacteria bacterium]
MRYLAILGRQPEISLAELRAQFGDVESISPVVKGSSLATFSANSRPELSRFGGSLKFGELLSVSPAKFLSSLPEGKITLGVSDYSMRASARSAASEALKLKRVLKKAGRSVRVLPNSAGSAISTAAAHHNGLGVFDKPLHVELMRVGKDWYRSIGAQNITAYARRDQARPARDARVGMLPPKLAQILINLCGELPDGARVLDPFCGTGVVLQEAILMGYAAYGTDLSERMVEYSEKNLRWLAAGLQMSQDALPFSVSTGDATDFQWAGPIDAVACETYLGPPMSQTPVEIKLKEAKQECGGILLGFLKNLAPQIKSGTPVVLAVPAWLRPDDSYSRLNLVDKIVELGYNVNKDFGSDLLYARAGQIVAREILILRKK